MRLKDALNAGDPSACSPQIVEVIDQALRADGLTTKQPISHAYRDSLFLARITSIAMMPIPRRGGVSRRPRDYAVPGDIALGAPVPAAAPGKLPSE